MGDRFFGPGTVKIVFAPAVANLAAPTRAEITAGVVLNDPGVFEDEGLADLSDGWTFSAETFTSPDWSTRYAPKTEGRVQAGDLWMDFYDAGPDDTTKRDAQAEGTAGVMLVMDYGDVTGARMESWPVKVNNVSERRTAGNEAMKYRVTYTDTGEPELEAVVPAP